MEGPGVAQILFAPVYEDWKNAAFTNEDVPGVGEEAVWLPQLKSLRVIRGQLYIQVSMQNPRRVDDQTLKSWGIEIAKLALAGFPY